MQRTATPSIIQYDKCSTFILLFDRILTEDLAFFKKTVKHNSIAKLNEFIERIIHRVNHDTAAAARICGGNLFV